jgi:hypothetical protein
MYPLAAPDTPVGHRIDETTARVHETCDGAASATRGCATIIGTDANAI